MHSKILISCGLVFTRPLFKTFHMKKFAYIFAFCLALVSGNSQSNFENHIGLSISQFTTFSERYRTVNDINTELINTLEKKTYSVGLVYNLDYKKNMFFFRTGYSIYYNNTKVTSLIVNSIINEIPLYVGIEYWGISIYTGISNNLNFYKFVDPIIWGEEYKDYEFTEENCTCSLKRYNLLWRVGVEYTIKNKFNIGFLYTLSPDSFEFVSGVGHKGYSKNSNIYLTYQF